MAERRSIWPVLVYGALVAIAAARPKETRRAPQRTRASGSCETVREPRRILYPAPDESTEIPGESRSETNFDPAKGQGSSSRTISRFSTQLRRAKERGRG